MSFLFSFNFGFHSHRASWKYDYEFALSSKSNLITYCLEQGRNLSLKKPAKRFASALPVAVGDNNKGSGGDSADNEEGHKINHTKENMEKREEVGDNVEEEGEAENGNDEDRRFDYVIIVG